MPLLTEANGEFEPMPPIGALPPTVGVVDPTPTPLPVVQAGPGGMGMIGMGGTGGGMGGMMGGGGTPPDGGGGTPPIDPDPDPDPGPGPGGGGMGGMTGGGDGTGPIGDPAPEADPVNVEDLYPDAPEGQDFDTPDVPDATGADVVEADDAVTEADVTEAETDTGTIVDDASGNIEDVVGTGEQTDLTPEQQVDAELARILAQDSPLQAQARADAAQYANQRGLQNSSMAAGMAQAELVRTALPMAQQNAQQAAARELANTAGRQEANLFTAEEQTRLAALEAELGQELSIFNADQLNEAERLGAELRTAIEQGNAAAYNDAAMQLADLQRDAEAQQAEMEYGAEEREFLETQAYNEQIIDAITTLNEQYMIGEQQIDIEHVRGTYNQIISTNETAATIYDSYLRAIGQIFDDPDMSSSQIADGIAAMVDMLEGSLRMISEMNGIDFDSDFLPGGGTGDGGTGGMMGMAGM